MNNKNKIIGDIRSARERGALVDALQHFVELPSELRTAHAAMLSLSDEQLDGIEQAVEYLSMLTPDVNGKRDAKAVKAALGLLDKQPTAWARRCEFALREALEALEGWYLVHEAKHVGHYMIETEYLDELDEWPVALAWGLYESHWFEPCDADAGSVVNKVVIECDSSTGELLVALPCAGVWLVWRQLG